MKKIKKPIILLPTIRKADNTWARSNKEQAEEFSNHLCNTFTPHIINNSNLENPTEEDAQATIITTNKEYTIPKTTAQEIRNIINKTKNNKVPEIDLINGKILKNLPPKAIRLMTIIFNAILRIQYFPKQWKLAQIKMLPKPGKDPHQTASYRPISLLPVFSKIPEKIIYYRIKTIIEIKKLILEHQFGFRNKHSTIEQMHRLINEIIIALEIKEYCTALFMDIEKAFDKINHESLLQTIRKQLPEQIYRLIKSYLSSRTFVIKIKDTYSEVKDIKAGVPQGSVLGPILYTLYTANIPTTTNSTVLTFADDTAILVRHTNPETAVKLLQEHITKI